jgi:L-ascorbate metabolism protein UlaG (beta-lactamase superfamily)
VIHDDRDSVIQTVPPAPRSAPPAPTTMERLVRAVKSGMRRYPRAFWESWRFRHTADVAGAPTIADESGMHSGQPAGDLSAVWIGHATVLLRIAGLTVLTDPVFSTRIGMRVGGVTFGLSRLVPPAIDVAGLPRVDVILLSHAHFDHLDRPSLLALAALNPEALVVTARATAGLIPRRSAKQPVGFTDVVELDWDREFEFLGLRIHAFRPEHWGARAAIDRHRGFNAYVLERGGRRVLFAGDTSHTRAFDRVGMHDLSIFGIGAYDSWADAHATPEEAWDMFQRGGGRSLLAMHHSTFELGEEAVDEPLRRLDAIAARERARVVCRGVGDRWRN